MFDPIKFNRLTVWLRSWATTLHIKFFERDLYRQLTRDLDISEFTDEMHWTPELIQDDLTDTLTDELIALAIEYSDGTPESYAAALDTIIHSRELSPS